MNVPNTLSVFRIILIPVFCAAFLSEWAGNYLIAAGALLVSALSDVFDGYLARKLNQITELGKWLDPIADKLTLGAVVACMWVKLHDSIALVTPMFAFLIIKEMIMAVGGSIVTHGRDEMIPSQWWGKMGTAVFYICMVLIMIVSILDLGGDNQKLIISLLVVLPALAMLFALARYIIFALKLLRGEQPRSLSDGAKTAQGHAESSDR